MFDGIFNWISDSEVGQAATNAATDFVKSKWKEGFLIGVVVGFIATRVVKL